LFLLEAQAEEQEIVAQILVGLMVVLEEEQVDL
jgi:hypothetical protein